MRCRESEFYESNQYASLDEYKLYSDERIPGAVSSLSIIKQVCDRRYGLRKLLACPVR